jgi:HdeA/HdeB family
MMVFRNLCGFAQITERIRMTVMRISSIRLAALLLLLTGPATAQMTVDVAKITCRQYLFDRTFSPRAPMIANWLSGYFNGQKNNTVVDLGVMAKNKDKVEDYCRMNQDVTLIEAAKNALGLPK